MGFAELINKQYNMKYTIGIIIAIAAFIYLGYSIRGWQISSEGVDVRIDTISYEQIEIEYKRKFDSLDSIKRKVIIEPQKLKYKKLDEDELEKRLNLLLKD